MSASAPAPAPAETATLADVAGGADLAAATNASAPVPAPVPARTDDLITLDDTAVFTHACKIVIIGDAGVGKTAITKRFKDGQFSNPPATINIDFVQKIVAKRGSSHVIKMQLWDTAGQERYHATVVNYFRGVQIAIVVYSVTQLSSFSSVQKWVDSVRNESPAVRIWLVGNKCDVDDAPIVTPSGAIEQRVIKTDEGVARAQICNADERSGPTLSFLETSAKSGANIDALFSSIASAIVSDSTLSTTLPRAPITLTHDMFDPEVAPRRRCPC
jgi:small GTP-binding protein